MHDTVPDPEDSDSQANHVIPNDSHYAQASDRGLQNRAHGVDAARSVAPLSSWTNMRPSPSTGTTTRLYCASLSSASVVAGCHALATVLRLTRGARCDTTVLVNMLTFRYRAPSR